MKTLRQTLAAMVMCAVLLFATLPVGVMAQGQATFIRKQPTTTTMQLVRGNSERSNLLVENIGSVTVAISNVTPVVYAGASILLSPNQTLSIGSKDAFYAITSSGTADLRITELEGGLTAPIITRLNTTGVSNGAAANTVPMSDGSNLVAGNVLYYFLTTAITPNSTSSSAVVGSLGATSNATGRGTVFVSDGTLWQLQTLYAEQTVQSTSVTIATTSTTDGYVIAPEAGILAGVDFSGVDALAASDSNFITFTVTNLGQAGAGSTAMLAATAANTTQVTGGTALVANSKRSLTLHGTAGNLVVAKGDRLRIRYAATGTLANTVTFSVALFRFTRTA